MHTGHTIPFIVKKYLQEAFDLTLVIQISDDKKYIYKQESELKGKMVTSKHD